ncbi:MAG: DUF1501 domain-containing protein [Candidatus Poribacteria bacterium]|nr:DUF1501 domain-containing protein [Candidatus Poribacteria bacterium]
MDTKLWVPEYDTPELWHKEISRRGFFKSGISSFLGLIAMQHFGSSSLAQLEDIIPRAKHCIVLFMSGGASQLDTFDPKPGTKNGGPFAAIPTSANGIQVSEHLPNIAEQAHHLSIIRSMVSREGNHERARYLLHTGYAPGGAVRHPTLGSITSHYLEDALLDLPSCVNINSPTYSGGFLGATHDPFVVKDPMKPVEDISYPAQMDTHRFRERLKMLRAIEKDFIAKRTGRSTEAHEAIYKKADELINSPKIDAFRLDEEPIAVQEAYGMNKFGQGCLMARRLVEAGVKFVEVSLDGWDTHQNNFERTKELLDMVDPAFAMLLKDLSERDLLEETLVLWLGEFGRTPRINDNDGRDHHTNGWSAVVAGGGTRGGQIVGGTNEDGNEVVSGAVGVPDLFASLCFALGIDGNEENYSRSGRPIRVVNDGSVIEELFKAI